MILFLAVFGFSLFDYFGYNLSERGSWLKVYRVLQVIVQIGIVYLLMSNELILDAILFVLLWWTWVCDWLYYVIDALSQRVFGKSFEGGQSLQNVISDKMEVSWAWWTILGLFKMIKTGKKEILYNDELIVQAGLGIIIMVILKLI